MEKNNIQMRATSGQQPPDNTKNPSMESGPSRKRRIAWVDLSKGISVLFIILSHVSYLTINAWILGATLPAFFFLSGYVFRTQQKFWQLLKSRIKTMIIPYFCIGILCFLFSTLIDLKQGTFVSWSYAIRYYMGHLLIQRRFTALWFTAGLFCLEMVCFPILKYLSNRWFLFGLAFICPVVGVLYYKNGGSILPWNADVCLPAIPYFFAGFLLKQSGWNPDFVPDSKKITACCLSLFISVLAVVVNWKVTGGFSNIHDCTYSIPAVTYVLGFSGTIAIVFLSCMIKPENKVPSFLRYAGENSFFFYSTHTIIAIPIAKTILHRCGILIEQTTDAEKLLYTVLVFVLVLVLTTIGNEIILHSPFRFIVGKS